MSLTHVFFFVFLDNPPLSPPVLSILTSTDKKQTACLAAGYYPKEDTLTLTIKGTPKPYNSSYAVLSQSKAYYYAAFSKDGIEKCQMNDKTVDEEGGYCKYS